MKEFASEAQARNELLTYKLYDMAGVYTPEPWLVTTDGKFAVASPLLDDVAPVSVDGAKNSKGVGLGFAADAWLANKGVVGDDHKLFMAKNEVGEKRVYRIGANEALLSSHSANGEAGDKLPSSVSELHEFRDPSSNKNAEFYSERTNKEILSSIDSVLDIHDGQIRQVCLACGPGTVSERNELADTLISRKEYLADVAKKILATDPSFEHSLESIVARLGEPDSSGKTSPKRQISQEERAESDRMVEKLREEFGSKIPDVLNRSVSEEHGLTEADVLSLLLYSSANEDAQESEEGFGIELNRKLRSGEPLSPSEALLSEGINKALSKLVGDNASSEVAKYYRGVSVDSKLKEGDSYVEPGFLSSTTDKDIVRAFGVENGGSETILFSRPGAEISEFSLYPDESEVLHSPNKSLQMIFKGFFDEVNDFRYVFAQSDLPESAGKKFNQDLAFPNNHPQAAVKDKAIVSDASFSGNAHASEQSTSEAAKPTPIDSTWTKTGEQQGSNPGGLYTNSAGEQWYVKQLPTNSHAHNEALANRLYQAAGVNVPDVMLVELDGKLGVATRFVDGLQILSGDQLSTLPGVREGFAADAWLANWDVVGLGNDNLLQNGDSAIRVDTGGALDYRATGGKKDELFSAHDVPEFHSLRDHEVNPEAADVFAGMTRDELLQSLNNVLGVSDQTICITCQQWGGNDAQYRQQLADKLISRKEALQRVKDELNAPASKP